jgi:hypothetical protein
MRHLEAIRLGEDIDAESGLLHAAHLQCNAAMLTEYYFTKQDFDNRKKIRQMILTDHTITAEINNGNIVVEPFIPENLGTNSIDLTFQTL